MDFGKLKIYFVVIAVLFGLAHPAIAENDLRVAKKSEERTATLYLESASRRIREPNFILKIIVDPGGQSINAVGIKINFSKEKLQVEKIDTKNSFCELFINNEYSNKTGQITINCGKPYPGVNVASEIGSINFKILQKGFASINFSEDSLVLANDGFGTDILESANSKIIFLK